MEETLFITYLKAFLLLVKKKQNQRITLKHETEHCITTITETCSQFIVKK